MKDRFSITRKVALLEGSSLLLLLGAAVPLKYWANLPIAVKIVGPIHGILFLSFVALLLLHAMRRDLSLGQTVLGLVAAFIPFGSFVYKAKVLKPTANKT